MDHSGLGGEAYSTVYVINICRFATLQVYFISFANLCAVWYMDFGTTINQPHVPTPSVSMDDQTSTSVLVIFHFPRYCRALPKKVYIYIYIFLLHALEFKRVYLYVYMFFIYNWNF